MITDVSKEYAASIFRIETEWFGGSVDVLD
jgi:hypothetical protein